MPREGVERRRLRLPPHRASLPAGRQAPSGPRLTKVSAQVTPTGKLPFPRPPSLFESSSENIQKGYHKDILFVYLRRREDSNLRYPFGHTGFQNQRVCPLCHASYFKFFLIIFARLKSFSLIGRCLNTSYPFSLYLGIKCQWTWFASSIYTK